MFFEKKFVAIFRIPLNRANVTILKIWNIFKEIYLSRAYNKLIASNKEGKAKGY